MIQNEILVECSLCKRLYKIEELQHLDIIEDNIRALSLAFLKKKTIPKITTPKYCEKYNIKPTDIFCQECKLKIQREK